MMILFNSEMSDQSRYCKQPQSCVPDYAKLSRNKNTRRKKG